MKKIGLVGLGLLAGTVGVKLLSSKDAQKVYAPTTAALLHNMSTLGISLKSMTNLLPEGEEEKD